MYSFSESKNNRARATEGRPQVLAFLRALHPADFRIREDGVVRLSPELAKSVVATPRMHAL
jgi:hypothetical protein